MGEESSMDGSISIKEPRCPKANGKNLIDDDKCATLKPKIPFCSVGNYVFQKNKLTPLFFSLPII